MDNGIQKIYRLDNQPFAQIPREAIRDPRMSANAFRLLAYLMSHENGYELTYGQIERQTNLGRFAINGAIDNLTLLGWLNVLTTKKDNGQFGPKAWQVLNPHSPATVGNSTAGNSTAGNSVAEQTTDLKNKKIENKTKENKTNEKYPQAKLEEAFSEFWQHYPRKVEKIAALKAFVKASGIVSPAVLIDGARRLAQDPYLPPKQFVPYPASWLNAGGWENEPYPERELTAEEKAAKKKADDEARWAKRDEEMKANAERLERERIAGEQARASVTICEHGRIIHVCKKCNYGLSNTPAA